MRKPSLLTLGAAALLTLAACGQKTPPAPAASAAASAAATETVTVPFGVAGPVSGGIAHIGKDIENGVRMALEEINASQPVIGGKIVRFDIVSEDDAGDPKQATSVAQKLCDRKVVAVIGHVHSGTTIPASRIYHECNIPQITPAATNPDVTKAGYNSLFRVIANDNQLIAAVAEYAAKNEGIKSIAIVDDRTAFGQGMAEVFKQAAISNGIEVVAHEYTSDKAVDFMAILTNIKTKKPDAIVFGGLDNQAGPMLRQMQQLGMEGTRFLGGDTICTLKLPERAANAPTVEGVLCATGGASVSSLKDGEAWLQRYETQFPKQFQMYSPYSYAATYALVEAMKQADSTDPKVYLPKLSAIDYDSLTGKIAFTPEGELAQPQVTLYTFRDGQRVEKK